MTKVLPILCGIAFSFAATQAFAGELCEGGAKSDWKKPDAVKAAVIEAGYGPVTDLYLEDGCYEAVTSTADGEEIEVLLDPITLAVVKTEDPDD